MMPRPWSTARSCSTTSQSWRSDVQARFSSPTGARSHCASSARAARWASPRSRSTRRPTRSRFTPRWPTRRSASARLPRHSSYLNMPNIISAAVTSGAEAIHPGYGFLAENAAFARAVTDSGLVFVGPSPDAIERMGDKAVARSTMMEAGVPCVPGSDGSVDTVDEALAFARRGRVPGPHQGLGRRWRQGHARGRDRRRPRSELHRGQDRGGCGFRQRRRLPREVPTATRATSSSRCLPTPTATLCISSSATARSSGAIRSSSRRRPLRR